MLGAFQAFESTGGVVVVEVVFQMSIARYPMVSRLQVYGSATPPKIYMLVSSVPFAIATAFACLLRGGR